VVIIAIDVGCAIADPLPGWARLPVAPGRSVKAVLPGAVPPRGLDLAAKRIIHGCGGLDTRGYSPDSLSSICCLGR
jgi:hypothetical protein